MDSLRVSPAHVDPYLAHRCRGRWAGEDGHVHECLIFIGHVGGRGAHKCRCGATTTRGVEWKSETATS